MEGNLNDERGCITCDFHVIKIFEKNGSTENEKIVSLLLYIAMT